MVILIFATTCHFLYARRVVERSSHREVAFAAGILVTLLANIDEIPVFEIHVLEALHLVLDSTQSTLHQNLPV
jgi:hypothetical protein